MDYVLWGNEDIPNTLVLKKLEGVKDAAQRIKLQSAGRFDDGEIGELSFTADPDYPNDLLLTDSHGNTAYLVTVSPRLKEFLDGKDLKDVQFFPVKFLDHKGNVAAEYFILHPTLVVDCIDMDASGAETSVLNADQIDYLEQLVVHKDRLPSDAQVFKIKGLISTMAVSRALADEIADAGFEGIDWEEFDEYSF